MVECRCGYTPSLTTRLKPNRLFANCILSYRLGSKERIAAASELDSEELLECLNALLARVTFVEEGAIPIGTWMEARRLWAGVDGKDVPFVTLTLHVDGLLWTADAELQTGLRARGFDRFFMR